MSNRLPYSLTALSLALALAIPLMASAADTTDAPATTPTPETKSLGTVIVTGTHTVDRTEAESLSPIDVITPGDLASSGASDLASALNGLLPSLDFPKTAVSDGNDALRSATLRGLSPDQVLVLVDGKRWHSSALVNYNPAVGRGSAPVDLNSIPIAAIDHIEVLRDGASAQYGSDAIAGVINIVLKHGESRGNEISANVGQYSKGDGQQNGIDGSYGFAFGPKDDGDKSAGWVRFTVNYQDAMNTNRAADPDSANRIKYTLFNQQFNPDGSAVNFPYERYGLPAEVTKQAVINFGYNFSPDIEAYGYVSPSRRDVTSNGYFRSIDWPGRGDVVTAVYPEGFLPQIVNHTNDINGVIGLRGTWNEWHWDVSADYGKNHLVFDVQDSINVPYYLDFGYSPTRVYAGTYTNTQGVLGLDVSKDFTTSFLPNPVTFAWGLSYRHESYGIEPGELASYYADFAVNSNAGIQVWPGINPDSAGSWDRHSEAAYVDFETNLTDKLSAGVAARYEDYSDVGSTTSGKISARYQLTPEFALRSTVSNGFRAPSLAQEDYTSISTIILNGALAQVGTFGVASPAGIALGAKPLSPETSINYSFGAVWQPIENFSSTLDLYQIRVDNEVVYSDEISLPPALEQQYGIQGGQFFVNGADIRARGADWINTYKIDLGQRGELALTGSANWNRLKMLAVKEPDLFTTDVQQLQTKATPSSKFVMGADWKVDMYKVDASLTRYGTYYGLPNDTYSTSDTAAETLALSQKYPARWLLNLSTGLTWKKFTFTIGADNLTNVYPQKVKPGYNNYDSYDAGFQYSYVTPFEWDGRFVYVKMNYKF